MDPPGSEQVALYDDDGRVVGSADRSRVRAENLRHGATAVVVRDRLGRVYLHRRTTTKDVYPGLLDLAAGGVLQVGEDPDAGAVREAEEELGVHGVPLVRLGEADYADDDTCYRAFLYTADYDGPIVWQPEEVSWGTWSTVQALVELLETRPGEVVPDSRALWLGRLREWAADRAPLPGGWDDRAELAELAELVEGRWVDRTPAPHRADALLAECRLLPLIAPSLPLEVPQPAVLTEQPLVVRHPVVAGEPCDPARLTAADGDRVGRFLRALHDTPPTQAEGAGLPGRRDDGPDRALRQAALRSTVLPLLPESLHDVGERLLAGLSTPGEQRVCHADLLPPHVLVRGGAVTGVVDFGDARLTDPALDLAWARWGTPEPFARAAAEAYGADDEQLDRAAGWWALVPWHEVHRARSGRRSAPGPGIEDGLGEAVRRLRDWADRHPSV
ncbi:aminoglycoside phosphotransferase (APT) family kinase protein [Terracoccus luteus]|uniref:Aminoglycoside phosphotransferase (APT) family kinase protein n=1 Tax=Terracoccus luteus TaxID=53356 RepID=A0A495XUX3_9MICO|nr:phosphotransferase [Terracoccus luteus]RKT77319.1 aminoglycoside phosphotransferase (APT) family kinase protein [Terracoccus luteus]